MMVMLVAGIGLLLGGLLTVGFGIEVDLSFGNTLLLAGSVVTCSGILLLGLWMVVRELKNIARRLGADAPAEARAAIAAPAIASATLRDHAPDDGFPAGRDQPNPAPAGDAEPGAPAPWHEETAARDRARSDVPAPAEAAPAVKPRRNLLFSSSSRKERERAEARTDLPAADPHPAPSVAPPSPPKPGEAPPVTFEDAWPQPERPRAAEVPPQRRSIRAPSTFTEPTPPAAPARHEDQPAVTVLKSGVVDGMAYSLYSDGSIEAQMPEGMMRFASIDELRRHLDQRP